MNQLHDAFYVHESIVISSDELSRVVGGAVGVADEVTRLF
jgi:hypothetical protein